ncbi:MAG TPA: hypothetical protein VF681_09485 [Abditibacteriaceae bacterium]
MYQSRFSRSLFFRSAAALAGIALVPLLARGQNKPALRALLVAGGPSLEQNEYAIESNARYLESLTKDAAWQRVHFADGKRTSRTIGAVEGAAQSPEALVLDWILDEDTAPTSRTVRRASTLKRIDGPSTEAAILKSVANFTRDAENARGLLYFTGHGSTGENEDTQNTTYAAWGGSELSARELAGVLQKWPEKAPLVLVMVQCHAGGFANLMFEGGDPSNPVWNRDFAGFFAATGDRQSSGCTAEMDERNYQDFTTHFFAALAGRTRDGQRAANADYDRNGAISMSEAFAYANINDRSIDVPVATSDTYLRRIYASSNDSEWTKTPYSQVLQNATPWQRAMLTGLSRELKLSGEGRVRAAWQVFQRVEKEGPEGEIYNSHPDVVKRYARLERAFFGRFPQLQKSKPTARTRQAALRWLRTQKQDVGYLNRVIREGGEVRHALLLRFVRATRTVTLQTRLKANGTPEQKAILARLRTSEGRNPLR